MFVWFIIFIIRFWDGSSQHILQCQRCGVMPKTAESTNIEGNVVKLLLFQCCESHATMQKFAVVQTPWHIINRSYVWSHICDFLISHHAFSSLSMSLSFSPPHDLYRTTWRMHGEYFMLFVPTCFNSTCLLSSPSNYVSSVPLSLPISHCLTMTITVFKNYISSFFYVPILQYISFFSCFNVSPASLRVLQNDAVISRRHVRLTVSVSSCFTMRCETETTTECSQRACS